MQVVGVSTFRYQAFLLLFSYFRKVYSYILSNSLRTIPYKKVAILFKYTTNDLQLAGTQEWLPDTTKDSDFKTATVILPSPIKPGSTVVVKVDFRVTDVGRGETIKFMGSVST